MKPTQLTELFANIKNTFVSFFSILMFVALGMAIFLGITWVASALQTAADKVYDEGVFHDLQIQFTYGLTDDDLAKLAALDGVTAVEPARQSFQEFTVGSHKYTAKVETIGSEINLPLIVEGELPTKADEIALSSHAAQEIGIGVGDVLTFKKDKDEDEEAESKDGEDAKVDTDGMKYLNNGTFKVTALVNSPEYLAYANGTYGFSTTPSGTVDILAFALPETFDSEAFRDGYPIVNVRCDNLRGMGSFSEDYENKSKDMKARVAELGDELSEARYHQLYDDAKADVGDAEKKLNDAKDEVAQKEKDLADARSQVQSTESELNSAYSTLTSTRGTLDARWADFNAQTAELQAKQAEFDAGVAQAEAMKAQRVAEATAQLEAAEQAAADDPTNPQLQEAVIMARAALEAISQMNIDDIEYPEGSGQTIGQARQALAASWAEANAGRAALEQGEAELQSGWNEYYDGQSKLEQARNDIVDGEQKLEDARKDIAENETKVADAKEELEKLKTYNWAVTTRAENAGSVEVTTFSDVTTNLSLSMAALFVIVGLLVSYSAVSRIVHEQITQIGTKKALGLRRGEITLSFLAYSSLAVIAGAIVGTILGITVVEGIVGQVLSDMFITGTYPPYFAFPLFLIVTLLEIALVLGATWFACHTILREHAVELLKGEKPPKAKTRFYEKWKIWDRLPLFTQTIVNNCVNDKRRVFSTVVGVAGCTALIVTAVTLNNDVLKSYDRHYENVYWFNDITYVDKAVDKAVGTIEKTIEAQGPDAAQALIQSMVLTQPNGDRGTMHIFVAADNDDFAKLYNVNSMSGGEVDLNADGVWIAQAYRKHFKAEVGDMVKVEDADGVVHEVPILGFEEFWLTNHEMVMGRAYYEKEFDAEFEPNVVLSNAEGASTEQVEAAIENIDGFYSISNDKQLRYKDFAEFASVSSAVVAIYLALAILMAIVVLLNLNVMFIDEKKRELIVLMINGFSVKFAKKYIYNDTIVLTAIGIILGLILGCVMGAITVSSIEPVTGMFVKDVDLMAVLAGVFGSAILALIMTVIALRRIPRFELTDINKF